MLGGGISWVQWRVCCGLAVMDMVMVSARVRLCENPIHLSKKHACFQSPTDEMWAQRRAGTRKKYSGEDLDKYAARFPCKQKKL